MEKKRARQKAHTHVPRSARPMHRKAVFFCDSRTLPQFRKTASIRSLSSPSPMTMSTSCPAGMGAAVRPSAVAFSSAQPAASCTKPLTRSTRPQAASVNRLGMRASSCCRGRPSSRKLMYGLCTMESDVSRHCRINIIVICRKRESNVPVSSHFAH